MASSMPLWLPNGHDDRRIDLTLCSTCLNPFISSRYPDWSQGIDLPSLFNQSLFLDMWDDCKTVNPYHWHGHALLSVTLDQVAQTDILPIRSMRDKSLSRLSCHSCNLSRRPIKPVMAILLRIVLGTSQTRKSIAQWSQRLLGLRIQWQVTTTEYVHDLIYETLFRAGCPISISSWYLWSDSGIPHPNDK